MKKSNALRRDGRLLLCVLAFGLGLPAPLRADGTDARAVIQETTDAVLAVLKQKELPSEERRRRIEDIVYERFDFNTLSRLVLARNWKKLSATQQAEFVDEFKKHLSVTYGNNVDSYNDEKVVITGDRKEARDDWTVTTKIARTNAEDILVNYRLRRKNGAWHVIDVIIEGVSLVANFRSQFQEIFSQQGPDKLIDLLREKNAKAEPLKS